MSNHRNELMDLHYASVAGRLLGGRPSQAAALQEAEPEVYEERRGVLRRLAAAARGRRASARPETTRA